MDIMYKERDNHDGFCIVSSDSGFTMLAKRFRENKLKVIGMGENRMSVYFINVCDNFSYLDRKKERVSNLILYCYKKLQERTEDEWVNMATLGSYSLYAKFVTSKSHITIF